ncbi:HNH endonuclease signature motif containing protein [Macrococcoides canis]|uniref:HNH endonuclease signature motif containing protein n=1 Tax=Macrococcoides canis TaxID=1855823 RepID=UPI0020B8903D|nr:HNH endonuclease signature motif containing protein [Macrococcus canis]UTH07929.1 HNH endonuclease [Macrococcus canis]
MPTGKKFIPTEEMIEWMHKNSNGVTTEALRNKFIEEYGYIGSTPFGNFRRKLGLSSGLTGYFKKSKDPWNKGKSYQPGGKSVETRFKKGNKPPLYRPVGSERVDKDGYVVVKVAEGKRWKAKHRHIWEMHNGPIPKGHVVIFNNRDKRDFSIDNLLLVSRKQLAVINKLALFNGTKEGNESALLIADLIMKINEKEKETL